MSAIIRRTLDPNSLTKLDPTLGDAVQMAWSYMEASKRYLDQLRELANNLERTLTDEALAAIYNRIAELAGNGTGSPGGGGTGTPGDGNTPEMHNGDGPPTDPGTKDGDLYYDVTNHKLYIWQNGEWLDVFSYLTPNAPAPVALSHGRPSDPQEGDWYYDLDDGKLYYYVGGQWVTSTQVFTPDAPAPVRLSATDPADPNEGDWYFNTSDNKLYFYNGTEWLTAQQTFTPDATEAIAIVAALPTLPDTSYPNGAVVLNKADNKLYKVVSGAWQTLAIAVAPNVPNAVALLSALPTLPDASYPVNAVVFLTTDNKIYKNVSGTWTVIEQAATIAAGSITAGMIQAAAIGTVQLAAQAVTTAILAADSVTAGKIQAGAVTATQLAASAVTTDKLAAAAIVAGKIAAGAIGVTQLAAGAVTADKLAVGAITAGMIAAGAIGTTQLAAQAITADKLASNNIITGEAQIVNGIIGTLKIAGNAVIVPVYYNSQSPIYGTGSTTTIATINFTLPYAGVAKVDFSMQQAYTGGTIPDTTWILYLDGQQIAGSAAGGGFPVVNVMGGGGRSLSAGSHTAYVTWNGGNASVFCGNINLSAMTAMR